MMCWHKWSKWHPVGYGYGTFQAKVCKKCGRIKLLGLFASDELIRTEDAVKLRDKVLNETAIQAGEEK
jgi:hypothetical protein